MMGKIFKESTKRIRGKIPIYEPYLPQGSLKHAHDALDSTWISNLGKYKEECVAFLKDFTGSGNCILTSSGTTATHLAYKALKIKKPKLKNILVPNNVYVAAWNSMLFDNDGVNMIPVETNLETWNMDTEDLIYKAEKMNPMETDILIVHNLGGVVNVPKLKRSLQDYEFIEDNCEGQFGKYEGAYTGTECLASSVSYYGNKTITSGEGGALFFHNEQMLELLSKIHSQGQSERRYLHDILGYNYRMTNVQAGILLGQLERLEEILNRKKEIFNLYSSNLKNISEHISLQSQESDCENANWMFAVRFHDNEGFSTAQDFFTKFGIEIRNMFYPMSHHEHLKKYSDKSLEENDNILLRELVIFPSSPLLSDDEVNYISNKIIEFSERTKR